MKRLICAISLVLLLAGCSRKTENKTREVIPQDPYRKGIERAREVQKKTVERAETIDSLSQGEQ